MAGHGAGSLHYAGQAVDIRTRDLVPEMRQKIAARIRECVGEDFDVILEDTHLHVEYQPKRGVGS